MYWLFLVPKSYGCVSHCSAPMATLWTHCACKDAESERTPAFSQSQGKAAKLGFLCFIAQSCPFFLLRASVGMWEEYPAWAILCLDLSVEAEVWSGCSRKGPVCGWLLWFHPMLLPSSLSPRIKSRERLYYKGQRSFYWVQEPGVGTVKMRVGILALYLWSHHPQDFDDVPFFPRIPGFVTEAVCVLDRCLTGLHACDPQEKTPLSHDMQAGLLGLEGSRDDKAVWQSQSISFQEPTVCPISQSCGH